MVIFFKKILANYALLLVRHCNYLLMSFIESKPLAKSAIIFDNKSLIIKAEDSLGRISLAGEVGFEPTHNLVQSQVTYRLSIPQVRKIISLIKIYKKKFNEIG